MLLSIEDSQLSNSMKLYILRVSVPQSVSKTAVCSCDSLACSFGTQYKWVTIGHELKRVFDAAVHPNILDDSRTW